MKNCLNCDKELIGKWQKKFCSSSCAVTINNKDRKMSLESKRKTSLSLGGDGLSLEEYKCLTCGKQLTVKTRFCQKCYPKVQGGMHLWGYEKKLISLLEYKFGKVEKELIDNIAFDFCNSFYIIEFTFDSTAGVSNMISRFSLLKDFGRKRIAFIPNKNVGDKRRGLLKKLKVEILSSDEYKYLL